MPVNVNRRPRRGYLCRLDGSHFLTTDRFALETKKNETRCHSRHLRYRIMISRARGAGSVNEPGPIYVYPMRFDGEHESAFEHRHGRRRCCRQLTVAALTRMDITSERWLQKPDAQESAAGSSKILRSYLFADASCRTCQKLRP